MNIRHVLLAGILGCLVLSGCAQPGRGGAAEAAAMTAGAGLETVSTDTVPQPDYQEVLAAPGPF